ncbi:peroxisomal targeting signal receptor [Uncinocarpus reesii 1704]|uniref:Peroxisomal targeting signal receptor n=1 Tax=Uncinocarpus reesii (strain UAMH 1704) TaxID=336963 RepID=C4JIV0_UNCRE|nr:peroxisomal targeting signal receptor [Uncinocarpus reesii 1704]EEP76708.1 peroxisomal targeting signal receptor [Uncinocarpus reesii 1704]
MSFLGGAECSSAGNPLTQFAKHVQNDKSLQRDRLVSRGTNGLQDGMRTRGIVGGPDYMMDEFMQQAELMAPAAAQPFTMGQMRRELENLHTSPQQRAGSPAWAAEFDPGESARMEAAFPGAKLQMIKGAGFSPSEFTHFSQQIEAQRAASSVTTAVPVTSAYQSHTGIGYRGLGGGYMNMMGPSYGPVGMQQQAPMQEDKGKGRMIELDDKNWEAQFAAIDAVGEKALDGEANAAMEAELDSLDRSVPNESDAFDDFESIWRGIQTETAGHRQMAHEELNMENMHMGDFGEWDNFDLGLNTHSFRDPQLGDYLFEEDNNYRLNSNPFEEGMRMMREGDNLSLAVLAFEAAVQRDPKHKVTDLFIRAAQLSPQGEHMDPDVQVGLGVLFYGAEEYDKAVDCFSAALASNESGTSNQEEQVHLLWNRLGATLANSGRSEEAIEAYEKALTVRPNFVRARYNLGVSCINIGCYPEAAQHLLGALAMHQAVDHLESPPFPATASEDADLHTTHNQSTNLYDTLRRVFNQMGRRDLSDMVVNGMDVEVFRKEFTF